MVRPLLQIHALGVRVRTVVTVNPGPVPVAVVGDHALAELRNDAAIHHPFPFGLVKEEVHQAIVPLRGNVVRRLPERDGGARPVNPVGRRDDVRSPAMVLDDRRRDVFLRCVARTRVPVHPPKEGLFSLGRHRRGGNDELLRPIRDGGRKLRHHVAGEDDVVIVTARDFHEPQVGLGPVDAVSGAEVQHEGGVPAHVRPLGVAPGPGPHLEELLFLVVHGRIRLHVLAVAPSLAADDRVQQMLLRRVQPPRHARCRLQQLVVEKKLGEIGETAVIPPGGRRGSRLLRGGFSGDKDCRTGGAD